MIANEESQKEEMIEEKSDWETLRSSNLGQNNGN